MENLFKRFGEVFAPDHYATKVNDQMVMEEMTGNGNAYDLLEELADSHCEECGFEKENKNEKFCNRCLGVFHRQDLAEQCNRERGCYGKD